MSKIRHQ